MGTLVGHVAPGFVFVLIGLWHLINHTKLHAIHPDSYRSSVWFKTSILRYLELYFIMGCSFLSIAMELFVGPKRHQPLDPDGTIPSNHLHNFEHASISMSIFIYASFVILLDKIRPKAHQGITLLLAALAFSQEFLLFHLHSTDHTGVEGQYHLLLQIVIFVSLITTLLGISHPKSFLISYVRSISILFQGFWLMVMGVMLWTPELIPKGCFLNFEEGRYIVRCANDHALYRAKSLANLQFSWFLAAISVLAVSFYLIMINVYANNKVQYRPLGIIMDVDEKFGDVGSKKKKKALEESRVLIQIAPAK